MKKALLIIAHGSRNALANDEVRQMTADVARRVGDKFAICEPAFLELAEPDIPGGVARCAMQGAGQIFVLPYFLNTGMHVSQDIPEIIEQCRAAQPGVSIEILPHIGSIAEMPGFIVKLLPQ